MSDAPPKPLRSDQVDRSRLKKSAARAFAIGLLLSTVTFLGFAGVSVRRWMWAQAATVHYAPDMDNAWRWGSAAARDGYFPLYDRVVSANPSGNFGLDYVPLRLGVMTLWAKSRLAIDPGTPRWRPNYEFNAPLLRFNISMECAAALAVFALAWMWTVRTSPTSVVGFTQIDNPAIDRHINAACLALLPATLAWLNPASIVSAHARPTWDVWIMPFYLWAIFCGCLNRWFLAGVLVGIGAMFKGQQLIVAPVFVLWPLMRIRLPFVRDKTRKPTVVPAIGAAGRWTLGFASAVTAVASPWLVPARIGSFVLLAAAVLVWPVVWIVVRQQRDRWPRFAARSSLLSLRWFVVVTATPAVWLCCHLFGGSLAWAKVGLLYGAEKFKMLEIGGASTLASILQNSYGWRGDQTALTLPQSDITLSVEALLSIIFFVLLVASAWAMASNERQNDRRFLLAVALPWLVYFAVAPRMHERYLLWGAIAACLAAAHSPGMTLLAVFFTLCSTTMSLFQILGGGPREFLADVSPTLGQSLLNFSRGTYPGIGWAILLATAIWLYVCLVPRRGRDSLRN